MSKQDYQHSIHVPLSVIREWTNKQQRPRSIRGPPPLPMRASALEERRRLKSGPLLKKQQPADSEYSSFLSIPGRVETIQPPGTDYMTINDIEEDNGRMTFAEITGNKALMPSARAVKLATQDLTSFPIEDIYLLANHYSIDPNQSFIKVCRTIAQRNLQKA